MTVNIHDVVEALQTDRMAGGPFNLHTLSRYSIEHAKIMELQVVKANAMARAFVRNFGLADEEYEIERNRYCSR